MYAHAHTDIWLFFSRETWWEERNFIGEYFGVRLWNLEYSI